MSDTRGMPLLNKPPPEYTANEPACRKCNKEFNILFARSRRCNHCGYSYCHSCTDYQALMPRTAATDLGGTNGYDPMPVCGFCIEMLQITASGKGQLKHFPMAKLKKYAKAYNIDVAGIIEKDEFVNRLVYARGPDGCLQHANESYYRKHSIPNRTGSRPRGLFTRAMDAMSGDRPSTSQTPPPHQQQQQQQPQYAQRQSRQRTTSGPSRYAPHGDPRTQQQSYRPPPRPPHSQQYDSHHPHGYAPPPGHGAGPGYVHLGDVPGPPGFIMRTYEAHPDNPNHLVIPPQPGQGRPRAASASTPSTPRATSPARAVVPGMDDLVDMTERQLSALSIGALKEILFKNHVTARMIVEKGELVARVKTLVEEERAERERKAVEDNAERALEEEIRREREQQRVGRSTPSMPSETIRQQLHEASSASPPTTSPPDSAEAPASKLSPKAQAMASRLERTGLCIICQDEEANIAIVDCGHLAMCRACSDLIMKSTRECPLCRTRIVTESRLLRIFKS